MQRCVVNCVSGETGAKEWVMETCYGICKWNEMNELLSLSVTRNPVLKTQLLDACNTLMENMGSGRVFAKMGLFLPFSLSYLPFPSRGYVECWAPLAVAKCFVLKIMALIWWEGVHDVKLHHPSSSVATSNQWCWSGVRGNINKLLFIVVMCSILLLHILWSY